jgi:ABC-2 type transport system permease protein
MIETIWKLTLAQLRMYVRDRQSMFLAFFFPLLFMFALGFAVDTETRPMEIGVVETAPSPGSAAIVEGLRQSGAVTITIEPEDQARAALEEGDVALVILLTELTLDEVTAGLDIETLVNAADPVRTQQAVGVLYGVLQGVEHQLRGTEPMFSLSVEDVLARQSRYIDFLIPGLVAFIVMQLAITGSGFNIVEYKRKGILKRLFVTPLRPFDFVASLISMRLITILAQITLMLLIALLAFQIQISGSILLMYLFVIAGGILFLSLGFALGGLARTQNAIILFGNLFIFPQVFLAAVFFPLDAMPDFLQWFARILPLTFVSQAIRAVANEGAGIADLWPQIAGIGVWTLIGLFLAVRFFRWSDAASA